MTVPLLVNKRERLKAGEPRIIAYRDQAPLVVEEITAALTGPQVDT